MGGIGLKEVKKQQLKKAGKIAKMNPPVVSSDTMPMQKGYRKIDWNQIQKEFIAGIIDPDTKKIYFPTKSELARKYNVTQQYISRVSCEQNWDEKKKNIEQQRTLLITQKVEDIVVKTKLDFSRMMNDVATMELEEIYNDEKLRIEMGVLMTMDNKLKLTGVLLNLQKLIVDRNAADLLNNDFKFNSQRVEDAFDIIYEKTSVKLTPKDVEAYEHSEVKQHIDDVVEGSATIEV